MKSIEDALDPFPPVQPVHISDEEDIWASDEDQDNLYDLDWYNNYCELWNHEVTTGLWWTLSGRLWIHGHYWQVDTSDQGELLWGSLQNEGWW